MSNSLLVYAAAKAMGVQAALLVAICSQESNLKNITVQDDGGSPSIGICQVKLETAKLVAKHYNYKIKVTENSLKKPKINAYFAAGYLKYQLEVYNQDVCKAVPAYNAGKFYESRRYPGTAQNYSYIKDVQSRLAPEDKGVLPCERKKK